MRKYFPTVGDMVVFMLWDGRDRWLFPMTKVGNKNELGRLIAGMNQGDLPSFQNVMTMAYEGLKKSTRFEIRPTAAGSRLTIIDEYDTVDEAQAVAVDRSLHAWGVALKAHLERDRRWRWLPLYRWVVDRVWLPMKPSARRITFLVLVIGLADIALIALGFAIYWLEFAR